MVLVDYYQSDYLLLAGKIVSVEARHASAIRNLIILTQDFWCDVVDTATGLDVSKKSIGFALIKLILSLLLLP
jgi:hypothetical protein